MINDILFTCSTVNKEHILDLEPSSWNYNFALFETNYLKLLWSFLNLVPGDVLIRLSVTITIFDTFRDPLFYYNTCKLFSGGA